VGLIQMSCSEDPGENLAKALARIEEAARAGARVICLQELFRTRYFCQREDPGHFRLAEPIPGPTSEALAKLAGSLGVALVAPLFERRAEGVFHNSAATIDADGALLGLYRKMHVPDDSLYQEKFYFAPGDLGFRGFASRYGRLGVLICWDQWFPEAARLTALSGAQILFFPTAIGWQPDGDAELDAAELDAWETIQRGHAIANGVFVAAVNRVGREGDLRFWGRSFVADPFGRVLARASSAEEEILLAECDLAAIETVRRDWPFLRDRRIDAYGDLDRRFRD
jgi:N-carbamoylputrescine amidase